MSEQQRMHAAHVLAAHIAVSTGGEQPSEEYIERVMTCYWNLLERMHKILQEE